MSNPTMQFIPLKEGVSCENPTTLDLIVRINVPAPIHEMKRPKLNIGLVIDRSGSMAGEKIRYARQAAMYAVEQLLPSDRISVTIYDTQVDVLVPSTLATNKAAILARIQQIEPRGGTALHAGWIEGGVQVSKYLQTEQLNRVILLSDGLANAGETNPDTIATSVHQLSQHGVSTTTMGVGNDYNEDLLEAMARSGDGNYYYIESPEQLPSIFTGELQGIMATFGQTVSFGIEPKLGVSVVDVLNNFKVNSYGRYQIGNLIMGNSIDIVVRLSVPAITSTEPICNFRLAWNNPANGKREVMRTPLQLPVVSSRELEAMVSNEEVLAKVAELMAARARDEVVQLMDRGDFHGVRNRIAQSKKEMAGSANPQLMAEELAFIEDLEKQLDEGEIQKMRKTANYRSYQKRNSR